MDAFQRGVADIFFRFFDSIILDQYDTFWESFRKIVLQFDRKWMDFHLLKGSEMPVYLDIVENPFLSLKAFLFQHENKHEVSFDQFGLNWILFGNKKISLIVQTFLTRINHANGIEKIMHSCFNVNSI